MSLLPVVCDTGPVIALTLLDRLALLPQLYHPILPQSVAEEWQQGRHRSPERSLPESYEIFPSGPGSEKTIRGLGRGESAVIRTAVEKQIAKILMDEKKGRAVARKEFGLTPIGTAGLLVEAKRKGLVSDLASLFEQLQKKSYWIAPKIVEWALALGGEVGREASP